MKTIKVCCGTGCTANGSRMVAAAFEEKIAALNADAAVECVVKQTGCHGLCESGPLVTIEPDNIAYVSNLAFCKTSEKQYEMLKDIYLNNDDNINRGIAVRGMLHIRGIIQSVDGIEDMSRTKELREKFRSDSKKERKVIIKLFEEGKL